MPVHEPNISCSTLATVRMVDGAIHLDSTDISLGQREPRDREEIRIALINPTQPLNSLGNDTTPTLCPKRCSGQKPEMKTSAATFHP
jgi:hypothetical protein